MKVPVFLGRATRAGGEFSAQIHRVIARTAQMFGNHLHALGKREAVVAMAAVVVRADGGLKKAGAEGGAAGRTHGSGGEGPVEAHPLGCQFVQHRRVHDAAAVAAQVRAEIFPQNPDDIGLPVAPLPPQDTGERRCRRCHQQVSPVPGIPALRRSFLLHGRPAIILSRLMGPQGG